MCGKVFSRGVQLLADWVEFEDAVRKSVGALTADSVDRLIDVAHAHLERALKALAVQHVTQVEQRYWDDAEELLEQRRKERQRTLDRKRAQKERRELWGQLDAVYAA